MLPASQYSSEPQSLWEEHVVSKYVVAIDVDSDEEPQLEGQAAPLYVSPRIKQMEHDQHSLFVSQYSSLAQPVWLVHDACVVVAEHDGHEPD